MILTKKVYLFIFFTLLFFFSARCVSASRVDSPVIVELGIKGEGKFLNQLFVKGLTPVGTEVLVYIDGIYVDMAKVKSEGTATDSFYYEHPAALAGGNEIKLIARDKTSLVLSAPIEEEFTVPPLPAPTLVAPVGEKIITKPKPIITGLLVSGTLAHIYIDGVYNGKTSTLTHESGTANFAYKPFLDLVPGTHKVWAVAEDGGRRKSEISNILEFRVESPLPAPTLFYPVVNDNTTYDQPFIVGLAKNNSSIKIFIDNKLAEQFDVVNHPSGTANFASKSQALGRGSHLVYATATDSRGKESKWSNPIYFSVRQPIISEGAGEKKEGTVGKIEEPVSQDLEGPSLLISPSGDLEKVKGPTEDISNKEIKDIIGETEEEKETASGLVDESKQEQGKLGINLIIFIIFVLGVIGWIFWVNRELVKEQKEKEDSESETKSATEEKGEPFDNSRKDKLF